MSSLVLLSRLDCAGAAGGRCWIVARSFVARSITRLLLLAFTNSRPWEWKQRAAFAIERAVNIIVGDQNIGSVGLLVHLAPLIPALVLPFHHQLLLNHKQRLSSRPSEPPGVLLEVGTRLRPGTLCGPATRL